MPPRRRSWIGTLGAQRLPHDLKAARKDTDGLFDQSRRRRVGITRRVEFHRTVAAIAAGLQDGKRFFHVNAEHLAVIARFTVLHMANVVSVLKHRLQRPVVEVSVAGRHGIREIGQGAKVRMVDGLDHFHHEERVLTDQIVILQMTTNFSRRRTRPLPAGFPPCAAHWALSWRVAECGCGCWGIRS